jgi:putative Holliday junction resolvase
MSDPKRPSISSLSEKSILGIDYGEKVSGLATYTVNKDPFPLLHGRIIMEETNNWIRDIKKLVSDEMIDLVVIGLPFYTDGKESRMTKRVRSQGHLLKESLGLTPLFFQDETLSSIEAKERMAADPRFNFTVDMKKIDAVAASIIIELFLSELSD